MADRPHANALHACGHVTMAPTLNVARRYCCTANRVQYLDQHRDKIPCALECASCKCMLALRSRHAIVSATALTPSIRLIAAANQPTVPAGHSGLQSTKRRVSSGMRLAAITVRLLPGGYQPTGHRTPHTAVSSCHRRSYNHLSAQSVRDRLPQVRKPRF